MTQQLRFIPGLQTTERQRLAVDAYSALRRTTRILPLLVEDVPHWHDAMQTRMTGATGTGDGTGIRGSDTSNPTLAGAIRNHGIEADEFRVLALMLLIAENVTELSRLLGAQRRVGNAPMLEEVAKAARCTGGQGESWALELGRPECVQNAVTNDGLCAACYESRRAWRRRREHTAVAVQQAARVVPVDTARTASVHKLVVGFEQWQEPA